MNDIEKFLSEVNHEVEIAYNSQNYEKAICCMKFLCSFYNEYDYKYHDALIEMYTSMCAEKIVGEINIENAPRKNVFFYDRFALNSRGIANIYIRALLNLNYKVIWCLFENGTETKQILDRYSDEQNLKFVLIPKLSVIDRMHYLRKILMKEKAYHYFLYTMPHDVECLGVFAMLKGSIKRYLINLTDHTFWLGTCALDCCIEFRNLGANLSVRYRGIDKDKITILPYYPENRKEEAFQGLPFSEDDEFVFSGGSTYKIEGSDKFEQMVSGILDKYQSLKFLFATNDKSHKLEMLASKYENRFFIVKERSDLNEIFRRAKFYLSTYPWNGALMVQFALMNQCIPLCLAERDNDCANPSSWLLNKDKIDFIFFDMEKLLSYVDQLMSENSSSKDPAFFQSFVITEKEFQKGLFSILDGHTTEYHYYDKEVNMKKFHSYYEKMLTQDHFRETVRRSKNEWLAEKYPELFCE